MKGVSRDYSKLPECDVLVKYIAERHRKGLGSNILVTGLSGTGKSSVSQRIAELLSKEFHGENLFNENDIVDSLLDLLGRIRAVKRIGEVIVVEEVSVLFPSRRAMAADNVAIGRILDTIRKKQIVLIANAPLFKSIDSHMRAMGHMLLETQQINKTQEVVVFKCWRLQTNPHSGKTYRHRLRREGRDVPLYFTEKPNKEIWDNYEDKKDSFMDKLYNNLKLKTEKKQEKEDKANGKTKPIKTITKVTEKELEAHKMVNIDGRTMTEVAKMLGVNATAIHYRLKNLKKKLNVREGIPNTELNGFPALSKQVTSVNLANLSERLEASITA